VLISISHRFILVCPVKTASTSVEAALARFCEIAVPHTEFGKHDDVSRVQQRYRWIDEQLPWSEFRVAMCVRPPHARLESLYRSHTKGEFIGSGADTLGLSPAQFVAEWIPANYWQAAPQFLTGLDEHGRFACDFVIRQEHLLEDLGAFSAIAGLPFDPGEVPLLNVSPELPDDEELTATLRSVSADYRADELLCSRFGGRLLTDDDRREIDDAICLELSASGKAGVGLAGHGPSYRVHYSAARFDELISDARDFESAGRVSDAISSLNAATALNPSFGSIKVWLGWLHFQSGNFVNSAHHALLITDRRDPEFVASRRLLVFASAQSGDWQQAGRGFQDLAAVSEDQAAAVAVESSGSFLSFVDSRYREEAFGLVVEASASLPVMVRLHATETSWRITLMAAAAALKTGRGEEAAAFLRLQTNAGANDAAPVAQPQSVAAALPALVGKSLGGADRKPLSGVTLITSIMPGRLDVQGRAIASWREYGAHVISLNAVDEAAALSGDYPDVEFMPADHDARQELGKPYVYIRDMLTALSVQGSETVGIVNSDVIFARDCEGQLARIVESARASLAFGGRYDVETLVQVTERRPGELFAYGFDWFLFSNPIAKTLDVAGFVFGCPWWDLWLPFAALRSGVSTTLIDEQFAYHVTHETNWRNDTFISFGDVLFAQLVGIDAADVEQSVPRQLINILKAIDIKIIEVVKPDVFFGWLADILRTTLRQASSQPALATPVQR
jgi:hypothetical protein